MSIPATIERKKPSKDSEYLYDESRLKGSNVENIWIPEDENEIKELLLYSQSCKVPFTVYAKGTGITGSAVAFDGDIVSMERFNSFLGIGFDADDRPYIRVQANCELADINEALKKKDLANLEELSPGALKKVFKDDPYFYPVDPTEMGASVGGTIATNASGARSYKFGPTRNWVKSLKVAFADGSLEIVERGRYKADNSGNIDFKGRKIKIPEYRMPKCKNAAGYYTEDGLDLIDLFIGSEGTLGIVLEAELWLEKITPKLSVIQFFKDGDKVFDYVGELKGSKTLMPDFIEYIDGKGLRMIRIKNIQSNFLNIPEISDAWNGAVFFDIDLNNAEKLWNEIGRICEKTETDVKDTWCAWENIESERIRIFRHALPETVNLHIARVQSKYPDVHKLGTDFSVCDSEFAEIMRYSIKTIENAGLKYVVFGHVGDNHVHINMLPENDADLKKGKEVYAKLAEKAVDLGGTVSAEHGIGKIKHKYIEIMYGEKGIEEMKRVKKLFDPFMLLNRDNIFKIGE